MPRSGKEILENDNPRICRLCLANEDDLINIFSPGGYQGYRLSEIIKELLHVEVSKEDGLPWTICSGCVGKVKDFKQFKATCIHAKIAFLTMIASRGYVSTLGPWTPSWPSLGSTETIGMRESSETIQQDNNQVEMVDIVKEEPPIISTRECPPWEVAVSRWERNEVPGANDVVKEEVETDESAFFGVYTAAPLPDPLDLIDMEEGNDTVKSLAKEETDNHKNNERENSLDSGVSDVMSSSRKTGSTGDECDLNEDILSNITSHAFNNTKKLKQKQFDSHQKDLSKMKNFICDNCGLQFFDKKHLNIHTKSHSFGEITSTIFNIGDSSQGFSSSSIGKCLRTFECDTCGKIFRVKSHLVQHLSIHIVNEQCKCDTCGKAYAYKGSLAKHINKHVGLMNNKCEACGKKFYDDRTLKRHHVQYGSLKHFKCHICGMVFTRKGQLKIHSFVHKGVKRFKCDICGKDFTRKGHLISHSLVHSGVKSFKCDICGKDFTRNGHLKSHSLVHSHVKAFKCDICGRGFGFRHSLNRHVLIHGNWELFK